VQDLGRPGFAHLGVPTAGAADRHSLRNANRLVGNADNAAGLEMLLHGLVCTLSEDTDVAVVGAPWSINDVPVPVGAAKRVPVGATVRVGNAVGVYSYLAVAGGIEVASVLGSRSADSLSGVGPAPVQAGDVLPLGTHRGRVRSPSPANDDGPLRVVMGPHDDWFGPGAVNHLLGTEWTVSPSSDRTGLRLSGPALTRRTKEELPSEGMVAGAIQVPPDGQPIVLLANHPTTGGYPVIAVLVSDDVDRAAQHRPGTIVRFDSQQPSR
jgi:biotin-dependent carboxylase-like uncharacterized protein